MSRESADLAAALIRQAVLAEGCIARPLVLHADNGSPMKGATMKVTMEKLGITASYSRPRVSNDNPFSEALFRTCKYRPDWPTKGFATNADSPAWVTSCAIWSYGTHLHSAIRFVTANARHVRRFQRDSSQTAPLSRQLDRAQQPEAPWSWPNPKVATGRTSLVQLAKTVSSSLKSVDAA